MSNRPRHPAGVPVGGQFASVARPPADVGLSEPKQRSEQERTDIERMDRIALVLGRDREWNGSADYLEEIADEIASSGRRARTRKLRTSGRHGRGM